MWGCRRLLQKRLENIFIRKVHASKCHCSCNCQPTYLQTNLTDTAFEWGALSANQKYSRNVTAKANSKFTAKPFQKKLCGGFLASRVSIKFLISLTRKSGTKSRSPSGLHIYRRRSQTAAPSVAPLFFSSMPSIQSLSCKICYDAEKIHALASAYPRKPTPRGRQHVSAA